MNIVKFQDIKLEGEEHDLYNNKFCGKYAYYIRGKFAFSFDDINNDEDYWQLEREGVTGSELDKLNLAGTVYNDCIDLEATAKANSIARFIYANEYVVDNEIPVEELKNFRTFVAEWLLSYSSEDSDDSIEYPLEVKTMLNYYASDMFDDYIKTLNALSPYIDTVNFSTMSQQNSCGCKTNAQLSIMSLLGAKMAKTNTTDLSNITVSTCDPIMLYKRYMYNCMVATFREISFWEDKPQELLENMVKYLEGILKNNLPLFQSDYLTTFADCDCLANANYSQLELQELLKRLIQSLNYIKDGEINEHKNYISTTLYEWSAKLYEKMRW